MAAVFMYLPSSVVFAITLFVCCRLHSHPQCIHCVFFLLRPKFCNGFTGWKILKRAKEASNSERLVSLGWELGNVQDITLKLSIFVQLIVIASWVQEL